MQETNPQTFAEKLVIKQLLTGKLIVVQGEVNRLLIPGDGIGRPHLTGLILALYWEYTGSI